LVWGVALDTFCSASCIALSSLGRYDYVSLFWDAGSFFFWHLALDLVVGLHGEAGASLGSLSSLISLGSLISLSPSLSVVVYPPWDSPSPYVGLYHHQPFI